MVCIHTTEIRTLHGLCFRSIMTVCVDMPGRALLVIHFHWRNLDWCSTCGDIRPSHR